MHIIRISRNKKVLLLLFIMLLLVICVNYLKDWFRIVNNNGSNLTTKGAKHRLAILVPFRDRFDELVVFVPHIHKFLHSQNILNFKIYILNQSRRFRFNRAALANVGFLLTKADSDYIAIHDVDLLPLNKNLSYSYPEDGPYHLASPEYHPNYNYDKYFGGILLINKAQFEQINGMSNRYFGWGLEDDEFYTRCKAARFHITRPKFLKTNKSNTFLHLHYDRKRDTFRTKQHREQLKRRDTVTGLGNAKFKLNSKHNLNVDGYDCTIFNIELDCDPQQTPWCLRNYSQHSTTSFRPKT